eukprot:952258-Pelagomonas_calceolata.AAC.2
MLDNFASDHCGLSLVLQVGGCTGSMDTETERNHAASNRAVGMTSLAKCAFLHARKQKGPLSPVEAQMFIEAVKCGEAKHACQFLRRESARCNRATKRCHKRQQCAVFLDRLCNKDPQIHTMLRKHSSSDNSIKPAFK